MTARWKREPFALALVQDRDRVFAQLPCDAWLCPECFEAYASEHVEAWQSCETWLEGTYGWTARPHCAACRYAMLVDVEASPRCTRAHAVSHKPWKPAPEFLGSRSFRTLLGRTFRVSLWDTNHTDFSAFQIAYHAFEVTSGKSVSIGSGLAYTNGAVDSDRVFVWGLVAAARSAYEAGGRCEGDNGLLDELDALRASVLHKLGAEHNPDGCPGCHDQGLAETELQRALAEQFGD